MTKLKTALTKWIDNTEDEKIQIAKTIPNT